MNQNPKEQNKGISAFGSEESAPFSSVGKRVSRPDSLPKALGALKYIDDLHFPGMIFAKILRSRHPHAKIISIDTSEAEAMPGVKATLTAKEIPVNSFGPSFQDQPDRFSRT